MDRNSVLFLTYWYPSKSNKSFGIFIKRHAHSIQLHHTIILLSVNIVRSGVLFKKTTDVFRDERGIETHQIRLESRFYTLLFMLLPLHYRLVKTYVQQHLAQHRFTIVHSNVLFPCAIIGHWLAQRLHCRHFITEHWSKIDHFFATNPYRRAGRKAYGSAAGISCVSAPLIGTLKRYAPHTPVQVIPNAVDATEFNYDPAAKKETVLTFIAVAYWTDVKHPFYFLNALKDLQAENKLPVFKLILVGNGDQVATIKQSGYPFEIDYKGSLDGKAVRQELDKSHIFVHGSTFETFSVIIIEALMCGLPCVVSPVGIATQVINADNGFVTDNTPEDWKEKILKCYQTTYDRRRISEQVKNTYSLEAVGKQFSAFYSLNS